MSDDETDIEASDEGEEDAVVSDEDEDQEEEEDDLGEIEWADEPISRKKKKKDFLKGDYKKLLFNPSNILDCFNQFMTTELKELLIKYTNLKGVDTKDYKELDEKELDAFLAILIASGVTQLSKVPFKMLWKDTHYVPSIFAGIMNRNRAVQIMRHIRFDDKSTRKERMETDKLAAVRDMYEMVVGKFRTSYLPSSSITVDERISPFKGRVGFKVFMPNKPNKYGIKLWVCNDAENYFVTNFTIYCGKIGGKRDTNQGENVVLELTKHLKAGYEITTDSFFTSVPLAMKLMQSENPKTLLGALRKNRKYIPGSIKKFCKIGKEKKGKKREEPEEYSSKFAHTEDLTIVAYIPKKNKSVIILSSSHPDTSVSDDEKKKPQLILDYNHSKIGVDKLDEMTKTMSCVRGTRRWTMNIFYNILDMICYNAYIAYKLALDSKISRRDFMVKLCDELCLPYSSSRDTTRLKSSIKSNIERLVSPSPSSASLSSPNPQLKPGKNDKCDLCKGTVRNRRHASQFCSLCHRKLCKEHQKPVICTSCN